MLTFAQFLADAARKGEAVNTLFEERLFDPVGILHKIAHTLANEDIPYERIGALAVLIHVEEANPEHSTITRDVDLMARRGDLERIREAGIDTLPHNRADGSGPAVNLTFTATDGAITVERKNILGEEVFVAPAADLVTMKLSSYRDKDRVHIRSMDAAVLITPDVENELTPLLLGRLRHIRETE
jgi:hypothetical protein